MQEQGPDAVTGVLVKRRGLGHRHTGRGLTKAEAEPRAMQPPAGAPWLPSSQPANTANSDFRPPGRGQNERVSFYRLVCGSWSRRPRPGGQTAAVLARPAASHGDRKAGSLPGLAKFMRRKRSQCTGEPEPAVSDPAAICSPGCRLPTGSRGHWPWPGQEPRPRSSPTKGGGPPTQHGPSRRVFTTVKQPFSPRRFFCPQETPGGIWGHLWPSLWGSSCHRVSEGRGCPGCPSESDPALMSAESN